MTPTYREFKTMLGGKELVIETGKYAEQTNGSCVVRCGETAAFAVVHQRHVPVDFRRVYHVAENVPKQEQNDENNRLLRPCKG